MTGRSSYRTMRHLDDGFTSGYTMSGPSWTFRPGSRADMVHRGRSGINRRYHSVYLGKDEFPKDLDIDNQRNRSTSLRETSSRVRSMSGDGQQSRSLRMQGYSNSQDNYEPHRDKRTHSTLKYKESNSGRIPTEVEENNWGRSEIASGQRNGYFEQDANYRNQTRPDIDDYSQYYDSFSNDEARLNGKSSSFPDFPPSVQDDGTWQSVRVIRYSDGTSRGSRNSSTGPRSQETAGNSSYTISSEDRSRGRNGRYDNNFLSDASDFSGNPTNNIPVQTTHNSQRNSINRPLRTDDSWHSTKVIQTNRYPSSSTQWSNQYQMTDDPHRSRNGYIDENNISPMWEDDTRRGRSLRSRSSNRTSYSHNAGTVLDSERPERQQFASHRYVEEIPVAHRQEMGRSRIQQGGRMAEASPKSRSRYKTRDDSSQVYRSRSADRVVFDGPTHRGQQQQYMSRNSAKTENDMDFLSKLQKELESQRLNWEPEINKLNRSTVISNDSAVSTNTSFQAGKNSYIDTSSSTPIFKAYVDVKEFSPKSVKVNFDRYTNKVVVEAGQGDGLGTVNKTFTQKVQLPRFADDTMLSARINNNGILRIEVPLLYYFPEKTTNDNKSRSFIYQAQKNSNDDINVVEIIVRPGRDISAQDLRVEVEDDQLVVWTLTRKGGKQLIKKYILPPKAIVEDIQSRVERDGSLTILIPVT